MPFAVHSDISVDLIFLFERSNEMVKMSLVHDNVFIRRGCVAHTVYICA